MDLEKLIKLEKEAKRGPWYAWLRPGIRGIEDSCITNVPKEQFIREQKEAKRFGRYRCLLCDEEVIGCSEWMRADDADFLLVVEMRNQLLELINYIIELESNISDLNAELVRVKSDHPNTF